MDRVKLTGKEYAALLSMFGAVSSCETLFPFLERRAKTVPGCWRDMRLAQVKIDKAMDGILSTIPEDKLQHVRMDVRNANLYVKIEPPGTQRTITIGYSYVPTKALNALLGYLCEHECLLCDKTPREARKCPWRQLIEDSLPHDVQARDGEYCKYNGMTIGLEE